MSPTRLEDGGVDEETPLCPSENPTPRNATPLPKVQIAALLTLWIAEAVVANSINPYINQVTTQAP